MASFLFAQQAQGWQQMFRRSQSGGIVARLVAWLALGVVLAIGLLVIVSVLLLSWLFIPVVLFRKRKAAKARSASTQAYRQHTQDGIIDGGITEVKEDRI
jgi:ABC-type transport system involved in cytochrome bd biosynthesis fused ATPase/permease subunit